MRDNFLLNRTALHVYSEMDLLMIVSVTCTGLPVHHPNCLLPQFATAELILLPGNTA